MDTLILLAVFAMVACIVTLAVRHIRMVRYFGSDDFKARRAALHNVVREHNDIARYAIEVRTQGLFDIGASSTGSQAHLARFSNTSRHNYRRDRNVATYAPHVHNCSLQVVRGASRDPIGYLIRYFGIQANDEMVHRIELLGESVSRLEGAISNLSHREADATKWINPPAFILKHYRKQLMKHIGITLTPLSVPYPEYVFEYVSAGGNSSQKTRIKLDAATIDALLQTLSTKVAFRKSAAGQRALMTNRLRAEIKQRDNYTCKNCGLSAYAEPNLLLEIDHIIPISRGGQTVAHNLQTLCWRCNRSKSNKMPGPRSQ